MTLREAKLLLRIGEQGVLGNTETKVAGQRSNPWTRLFLGFGRVVAAAAVVCCARLIKSPFWELRL